MSNPFSLYWNKDWKFQIVHMSEGIHIEGYCLGLFLRAPFTPNENPHQAADQLVVNEDRRRKSLASSWRSQIKT